MTGSKRNAKSIQTRTRTDSLAVRFVLRVESSSYLLRPSRSPRETFRPCLTSVVSARPAAKAA